MDCNKVRSIATTIFENILIYAILLPNLHLQSKIINAVVLISYVFRHFCVFVLHYQSLLSMFFMKHHVYSQIRHSSIRSQSNPHAHHWIWNLKFEIVWGYLNSAFDWNYLFKILCPWKDSFLINIYSSYMMRVWCKLWHCETVLFTRK